MNEASQWRIDFARERIVPAYAASSNVGAVFVAGSVARGLADRFSDVELHVFWKEFPSYDERIAVAEAAGGSIQVRGDVAISASTHHRHIAEQSSSVGYVYPRQEDEWSDLYFVDGVYLDVSGFLCSQMESYLDGLEVLRASEARDSEKSRDAHPLAELLTGPDGEIAEMLVSAIEDGIVMHGQELAESWRTRCVPYPAALSRAVLERNLVVDKDWWAVDQLVEREERLLLYEALATMQRKMMRLLLALNRIYLTDNRLKWIKPLSERMTKKPTNFAERLTGLYAADLGTAVAEMQALCEEVWDDIDREFPQIDGHLRDRWFRYRRPAPERRPL